MRFGWAGFFGQGRLRTIERGLADMRETLAALVAQASLAAEQARGMAELAERVTALEGRCADDRLAIRKMAKGLLTRDTHDESRDEELVRLGMMLTRLDRQMTSDAEEARKVAMGLLERIEQARQAPSRPLSAGNDPSR